MQFLLEYRYNNILNPYMEEYKLGEAVENYIINKDNDRLKGHRVGPSEISCPCIRQIVWNRALDKVQKAVPKTIKEIGRLMLGTAIHEYFQNTVLPSIDDFEVVECERHIENEYMNGYIDVIIKFKSDDRLAVLELKTAEEAKFQKMYETGKPLTEHIEQLTFYEGITGIHEGYIFVINKGMFTKDSENDRAVAAISPSKSLPMFLSLPVFFNEDIYAEITERAKSYAEAIKEYNDSGKEPVLPKSALQYNPNGFPCLWCRFRCLCHDTAYKSRKISSLDSFTNENVHSKFKSYMKAALNHTKSLSALTAEEAAMKKLFYILGRKGISEIEGDHYLMSVNDGTVRVIQKDVLDVRPENIKKRSVVSTEKQSKIKTSEAQTVLFNESEMFEEGTEEIASQVKNIDEYADMILSGSNFV